jgi:transcriptional regulator with XRE-family HTH domain
MRKRDALAKDVKALRERMNVSQEGLARLLGVALKSVSRWEAATTPAGPLYAIVLDLMEDAIAASVVPQQRSKIDTIRDEMTPKERAELDAALTDPRVTLSGLSKALGRRGHQVTGDTIGKYIQRRGLR